MAARWLLTFLHPAYPSLATGLRAAVAPTAGPVCLVDGGEAITLVPEARLVTAIRWVLRGDGDTVSIAFSAAGIACRPLDVVQVWTPGYREDEDPTRHYPRAAGRLTRVPSPLHRDGIARAHQAVGLRSWLRFLECAVSAEVPAAEHPAGMDVAAVAGAVLTGALGGGAAPPLAVGALPALGVATPMSLRFAEATLAEALSSLVALAPGSTWGVRPDRSVFLERPSGETALDGQEPGLHLVHGTASSEPEGAVTRVRWRLGRGNAAAALYAKVTVDGSRPDGLTHLSIAPDEPCGATTVTRTPPPGMSGLETLSLTPTLEAGTLLASRGPGGPDAVPNLARLADGDPGTSATLRATPSGGLNAVVLSLTLPGGRNLRASDVAAVEVRLKAGEGSSSAPGSVLYALSGEAGGGIEASGHLRLREAFGSLPAYAGTVLLGDRARCGSDGRLNGAPIGAGNGLRLELLAAGSGESPTWEVECFRVSVLARSLLDAAAGREYRAPAALPVSVRLGREVGPTPLATVTLPDGSTPPELCSAPAGEWRYALTRAGVSTTVLVGATGEPADAEARSTAARLREIIERAATRRENP